jgi:arginase
MFGVVTVRCRNATTCVGDERGVDGMLNSSVLNTHGVQPVVLNPTTEGLILGDDVPLNIGKYNARIADAVASIRQSGQPVMLIGGDCSHTTGVFAGLQKAHGATARIGLIWFDAHGDFNTTKTTLSGMLGGMPVAVCAGLTLARWREAAGITVPLPTNRIVMVDVRNLDPAEATLIESTDVTVVRCDVNSMRVSIASLVETCDFIYLHIDEDILDARYVPNHGTVEPNGPDMATVQAAIRCVHQEAGDKLVAQALVSVYNSGPGAETSLASGIELLSTMREIW